MILPNANTEMMNIFLRQVSEDFKQYKIIMQVDGAGRHKSKNLEIPENIVLLIQPAYSPELNPVEQIWAEIIEKFLGNILFENMDSLIEKLCLALNTIQNYGEKLKSLTNFPHFKKASMNAEWYEVIFHPPLDTLLWTVSTDITLFTD